METFSLRKETAGDSFRVHTDQDGTSRSITVNGKEMRGVRKGRGKMRGLTFQGKKKEGDNHFPSVSHSIWGADSSPYRNVLETKEALDTRAL